MLGFASLRQQPLCQSPMLAHLTVSSPGDKNLGLNIWGMKDGIWKLIDCRR